MITTFHPPTPSAAHFAKVYRYFVLIGPDGSPWNRNEYGKATEYAFTSLETAKRHARRRQFSRVINPRGRVVYTVLAEPIEGEQR